LNSQFLTQRQTWHQVRMPSPCLRSGVLAGSQAEIWRSMAVLCPLPASISEFLNLWCSYVVTICFRTLSNCPSKSASASWCHSFNRVRYPGKYRRLGYVSTRYALGRTVCPNHLRTSGSLYEVGMTFPCVIPIAKDTAYLMDESG
jgi:hypothetical protein